MWVGAGGGGGVGGGSRTGQGVEGRQMQAGAGVQDRAKCHKEPTLQCHLGCVPGIMLAAHQHTDAEGQV
jgi:hypothetical protein